MSHKKILLQIPRKSILLQKERISPSQSGLSPSESGPRPSKSWLSPSQSGLSPSQSELSHSQSGLSPSRFGSVLANLGSSPSSLGSAPCKIRKKSQKHSNPTFVYKDKCINKNNNIKKIKEGNIYKETVNTYIMKQLYLNQIGTPEMLKTEEKKK